MNDKDIERLLQDELEGVATPEESERLQGLLARSEQARARRDELRALFQALSQVPREDAPMELKEGVMAAIAAGHETATVRTGPLDALRAALRGLRNPAWASPFLAGAVAGGVVIALVAGLLGPRARTDLPVTGTMSPQPPEGTTVRQQELTPGQTLLPVEARRVAGGVQVRFAAPPGRPIELTLEYDPAMLRPVELRWTRPGDHRAAFVPGRARLELTGGDQGALLFAPAGAGDATIRVTMQSEQGTVQGTFHTAMAGRGR